MSADFLVEIGTEELPPKSLLQLSNAFHDNIVKGLKDAQLSFESSVAYASPRRLAVLVKALAEQAPSQEIVAWGPPAKIAFDDNGNPAKAAEAFAKKNGIDIADLKVENDGKQDKLCHRASKDGAKTSDVAAGIIEDTLKALPIAKRMRWGASRTEFVRPMHWLVLLHGDQVLDANVMGIESGRITRGHRIHSAGDITVASPAEYLEQLRAGYVMADFAERRELIRSQVEAAAEQAGGQAVIDSNLLDEVTALNEWPTALLGRFEERFLDVPAEALISSMKEHQKYFHVIDDKGALLPLFITVANIESKDPAQVIAGNERVIRPRLADAAFFYETDKKVSLETRREKLQKIVFQAQLGTIYEKTERVASLAETLATAVGGEPAQAKRAAQLSKSDLVSEMVLEFSDLQGLMGRYYAQHDGEDSEVAEALYEQYLPRFAGDQLPHTKTGTTLALADRIDTLVGIFGIGMTPTGSKDPFALRRASLGVLRLLVENNIDLDLREVLTTAASLYGDLPKAGSVVEQVLTYMTERFRAMTVDQGIAAEVFMSVAAKQLSNPLDIHQRVQAVHRFSELEEAAALAAANKRVSNILAKSEDELLAQANTGLMELPEEVALLEALDAVAEATTPLVNERQYTEALQAKAALREPVDNFFDKVMVNVDNDEVRRNRLTLLAALRDDFLRVADISLLVPAK
ncbi:glycine--tRNA ligase subunit beta [Porticoccus sp. W117]|uniref:glycine--tRNA ligase subunit beta n=1 Tax=Porticoccus sp. W117 TaxID=3054777 RepID=UPI002598C394|nr:glycine--tRNA ligase subunit beta [Porticoccus sp. W117]MDM3870752.1 glycine--tRNA ligase subunit beta [Porticoccus sp. W117]